jgi:ribosomal-protein-serine acetyltransferase
MQQQPTLRNDLVLLRPLLLTDVEDLYFAVRESIPELSPWMPWCTEAYSITESKKYIEEHAEGVKSRTTYEFAITDAKTGMYLGDCGLNNINPTDNSANLGYWVRTSQTRKGIATASASLLAKFGIETLKLNRIEIVVAMGNKASQRVAAKVGATREGILRNRIVVGDKIHDAVMFSIIPGDNIK